MFLSEKDQSKTKRNASVNLNNSELDPKKSSSSEESVQIPASVRAARWMFVLLGAIWLVFGTWSVLSMSGSGASLSGTMLWLIAIFMFVNSALLIWIGWGIGKGLNLYYYFGLLALAANIFLTLTDEFGFFDLIVLIIAVSLFVLLIVTRAKYFGK